MALKRAQVYELPTERTENCIVKFARHYEYPTSYMTRQYLQSIEGTPLHIYLTTNDPIFNGDHYIDLHNQVIMVANENSDHNTYKDSCKKIIGSSDEMIGWSGIGRCEEGRLIGNSSKFGNGCIYAPHYGKPTTSFMEKYCKLGGIKEVLVEFNEPCCKCDTFDKVSNCVHSLGDVEGTCLAPNPNKDFYGLNPKLDSHNTLTIKRIKDSWNREELDKILSDVMNLGMSTRQDQLNGYCSKSGNEILEEYKQKNL